MALNRQIHIYNIDTACFYNDKEKVIGDKLTRLYSIRFKTKNANKENSEYQIRRLNRLIKYFKQKLVNEFEITRSQGNIRVLRNECINDRNIISIFESTLVRQLGIKNNELSKDLMVVQVYFFQVAEDIIKHGFMYDDEKYILFSASAGQIRTKKFVAIKESRLNDIKNSLMCGMTWDRINECGGINTNKYLAYYALNSSATDVWTDFDIDKAIVVKDFTMMVNEKVDYIDDATYEITRQNMPIQLPHMDGCGIKLYGKNHMVRMPWFKGLMGTFRFDRFVLEMREKYNNPYIGKIKDIWGKVWDVIDDNIEYIFTESQMKINIPYYSSWEEYKTNFKKYNCEACLCNIEEDNIKNAKINYQMLQTLTDMTSKEFELIAHSTIQDITKIGNDYRTTLRLLGVYDDSINWMQKSIAIYPELMRDKYNHQILRDVKSSLVKKAKAGRLNVNGKYTFVMPDLYAFCEWLFLGIENPKGLISKNEVICNLFPNNHKLCCLRSPHLYREWGLVVNKINDEISKWYSGSNAIYVSTYSLLSKLLMFDSDGDILLVIDDKRLYRIAERNMAGIVPLYYNMRKAHKVNLNYDTIYNGLSVAYTSANIGIISNNISKVWNCKKITQEQIDVVKLMCMENNEIIDFAKTLYKSTPPEDKADLLKKYTSMKLPHFFKYAKNKSDEQVQDNYNGIVNMLESIIPEKKIKYDSRIPKVDVKVLLSDPNFELTKNSDEIIEKYDYWNKRQFLGNFLKNIDPDKNITERDIFITKHIRDDILLLPYDKDFIVNSLVMFLYTKRNDSYKKLLWATFGEEIYNNILKNTQDMNPICPICGRRIKSNKKNRLQYKYCSDECYNIAFKEKKMHLQRKYRK